jgi:hypothetical protein
MPTIVSKNCTFFFNPTTANVPVKQPAYQADLFLHLISNIPKTPCYFSLNNIRVIVLY